MNTQEQNYTPEKTVITLGRGSDEYYIDRWASGPRPYSVTLHERQLARFNSLGDAVEFVVERMGKNSFIACEGYSQD